MSFWGVDLIFLIRKDADGLLYDGFGYILVASLDPWKGVLISNIDVYARFNWALLSLQVGYMG